MDHETGGRMSWQCKLLGHWFRLTNRCNRCNKTMYEDMIADQQRKEIREQAEWGDER